MNNVEAFKAIDLQRVVRVGGTALAISALVVVVGLTGRANEVQTLSNQQCSDARSERELLEAKLSIHGASKINSIGEPIFWVEIHEFDDYLKVDRWNFLKKLTGTCASVQIN